MDITKRFNRILGIFFLLQSKALVSIGEIRERFDVSERTIFRDLKAMEEAGIALLTEADYRMIQQLGKFDLKTSSWVSTPSNIRRLGGAVFCDRRYDTVFLYHNGAESYYAVRGFRGKVSI